MGMGRKVVAVGIASGTHGGFDSVGLRHHRSSCVRRLRSDHPIVSVLAAELCTGRSGSSKTRLQTGEWAMASMRRKRSKRTRLARKRSVVREPVGRPRHKMENVRQPTTYEITLPFCQLHKLGWLELVESLAIVIIIFSFTAQARHMPHVRNRCAD